MVKYCNNYKYTLKSNIFIFYNKKQEMVNNIIITRIDNEN
jgi:hypothetical protein